MDDPQLPPTALFSPSKAAQQRAAAQDWQRVDVWLSSKFQGRTVPQFERNEDTLRCLQALAAANEKADDERDALWSLQKEALAELKAHKETEDFSRHADTEIHQLMSSLDGPGKEALQALAELSVAVDAASAYPECLAESIIDATQTSQSLSQQLLQLQSLQKRLETELLSLRQQLQEIRSPIFQPPLSLQKQTLEWTRNTKQLRSKLAEYSDRLAALQGNGSAAGLDIVQLAEQEQSVVAHRKQVDVLETQVEAYRGLPKQRDDARKQVEKAGKELEALERARDRLFEAMVEKG